MASAANGQSGSGSGSGSGSHEITEEEDRPYLALMGGRGPREGLSGFWKQWAQIPFIRTEPPCLQPELENIAVDMPQEATAPEWRDKNLIQRKMAAAMRYIKSCFGGALIRSSQLLSLNDMMSAELLGFISNAAAVGIPTLSIYSATYFLAWRKESSSCNFPFPPEIFAKADNLTRLIVISLPFICLPVAFVIGGLAHAAKRDMRLLGCAAGLVLCEIIYILFLGAVMMTCMSNVPGTYAGIAAMIILVLIMCLWGCFCPKPKGLRYVVLSKCCFPDPDADEVA